MMMGGMFFYEIFFLIIIVAVGVFAWQSIVPQLKLSHHKLDNDSGTNAISIVKERYAKGEITKEQFEQMKKDLI